MSASRFRASVRAYSLLVLLFALTDLGFAQARAETIPLRLSDRSSSTGGASMDQLLPTTPFSIISTDRLRPVPLDSPPRRFVVGKGVVDGGVAGATGTNIYRNTLGAYLYPPGEGVLVADDITTVCAASELTYIEVAVNGGGNGGGPGFDVEFNLYDACPSTGGAVIPGTQKTASLPDDGTWLVALDLELAPVLVSQSFWIGMTVSTNDAGWFVGANAEIGSSQAGFDGVFGCFTTFGPCPQNPCANLYADIYANNCVPIFQGYRSPGPMGAFYSILLSQKIADDILPITAPELCDVARYESYLSGINGPYNMVMELWTDDNANNHPDTPVLGTFTAFSGAGDNTLELAVREVLPPLTIPTPRFWIVYDVSGNRAGPRTVYDHPNLGSSIDGFSILGNPVPGVWSGPIWHFGGCSTTDNACGTFAVNVFCAGNEPTGACCDSPAFGLPEVREDAVRISACSGRFARGESCASEPFSPPCGVSACCKPDGTCEDLDAISCEALGGLLEPGEFCDVDGQSCPPPACITATQPCDVANPNATGCNDPICCETVCNLADYCCNVNWAQFCADIAFDHCHAIPPDTCSSAVELQCNQPTIIDNTLATNDSGDPGFSCHFGGAGSNGEGSVWVKFTAVAPTARLRTCNSQSPATDSLLAVYRGSCDGLIEIACSDDESGCGVFEFNSEICLNYLVIGSTYHVQLASWTSSDRGRYLLEFECPAPPECAAPPLPACCLPNGDCVGVATLGACLTLGGLFVPESLCGDDFDGDGCDVCIDSCPDDPNKCAPLQCGCGLPETDTDGDGTADCVDGCVNDPAKSSPGVCGCGVSEQNLDGDLAPDCIDECDVDPLKTVPGVCGCGVPEVGDLDGDGCAECIDGCPGDSAKCSPGVCGCGVLDTDSDLDTVEDCNDGCPFDPAKIQPGACGCGVPDVDTDVDTVLDCDDRCPADDDRIDDDGNGIPDCLGLPVPTVGAWGLVILGLLLITLGRIRFGARA